MSTEKEKELELEAEAEACTCQICTKDEAQLCEYCDGVAVVQVDDEGEDVWACLDCANI